MKSADYFCRYRQTESQNDKQTDVYVKHATTPQADPYDLEFAIRLNK